MTAMTLSPTCLPRFATARTPSRRTFGGRIASAARVMGKPLMPWQQLVADVGGELLDDGRPAFREVWVTVPRQNGKTTLILAWEVDRCLNWSGVEPQRVLYSAQNGNEAA
jgi:phage terminase large subunit-like protein